MDASDRAKRVDITDEWADIVFSRNIGAAELGKDLFQYSGTQMKQRVKWDEVIKYRGSLADMFTASKGYLVHQLSLEQQFKKWLKDIKAGCRKDTKAD